MTFQGTVKKIGQERQLPKNNLIEVLIESGKQTAAFTAWGDEMIERIKALKAGTNVDISYTMFCREHNGKFYNSLNIQDFDILR